MSDLASALMIAIRVHADQTDQQGEPYLLHVLRVVEAVSDEAKVVAALHDVLEDGDSGWEGYCGSILSLDEYEALTLLTRFPEGETYAEYIAEIAEAQNPFAREVKLADLRDNLNRVPPHPGTDHYGYREWLRRWHSLKARYEKAIQTLDPASPAQESSKAC